MDYLAQSPVTMCSTKAGLAAGTTVTITTANTVCTNIEYCIKGLRYAVAVGANQSISGATDVNTGAAFVGIAAKKGSIFVVGYDASGSIKIAQGSIEDLDTAGNFVVIPRMPAIPDTVCPVGYFTIKLSSAYVANPLWTLGTATGTLAATTGMTISFHDVACLPDRPTI